MKPFSHSLSSPHNSSARRGATRSAFVSGPETPASSESPDTEAQILARRAQALAQPPARADDKTEWMRVLAFTLDRQTFAIESSAVLEVIPLAEIAHLPGLPSFVRGLINLRSRVVPAFDPRPLFGLPPTTADNEKAILVAHGGSEFFLLVDTVTGLTEIPDRSLRDEVVAFNSAYLQGVDAQGMLVLDLPALHRDLVIDDTTALPSF